MADLSDQLTPYKVPPGGMQTYSPSTPDELLNNPVPQNLLPQTSATGLTTEQVSHWNKGLENFKDAIMDPLTLGASSNTASVQGLNAWGNPELTPEQMRAAVESDDVIRAQQHRDDYNNANEWSRIMTVGEGAKTKGFYAADLGGAIIEAIPQMAPIMVGAGYGATAGAMTGTLPGIMLGALGGMAVGAFAMVGGHHTYDMMQRGVNRQTAITGGIIMGSIGAGTQILSGALLGKVVPEMATTLMRSGSFRAAISPIAMRLLTTAGINTGAGQVQSTIDSTAKYFETTATGNAPGTEPLTYKEAQDAFMTSLMTGAATNVAAEGVMLPIGLHIGLNTIKTHAERLTAEYTFQQAEIARKHLEAQQEAAAETQRTTEVSGQIVEKQAESERKIGFLSVNKKNTNIAQAMVDLDAAEAALKADPKSNVAKLGVARAKAQLEHARYQARVEALEDALTDPDLIKTGKLKERALNKQVQDAQDQIDDLVVNQGVSKSDPQVKAFKAQISLFKKQIKEVRTLTDLASHEKAAAAVKAMQTKLQQKADKAFFAAADASLQLQNETLKGQLEEAIQAGHDKRADNLANLINANESTRKLIEVGGISVSDIEYLAKTTPSKKLQGLARVAQRLVVRAAKLGEKQAKRQIAAARKLLYDMIDKSRLPDNVKDRLQAEIKAMNFQDIQNEFDNLEKSIDREFETQKKYAAVAELKRRLPKDNKPRTPSKFPGVTERIDAIVRAVKDFDKIGDRMQELAGKAKLTDWEDAELDIYQDLFPKPVKDMSVDQVMKIINTIIELETEGKSQATKRIDTRRARAAEKGEDLDRHMMTPNKRTNMTRVGKLLDTILDEGIQNAISSWRGLMTVLTKLGTVSDMAHILDPKTAGSKADLLRKFWEAKFQAIRQKAGISDAAWAKMQVDFSKQAPFLEYRRATGSAAGVKKGILGVLQRASVWRPKMTNAELMQIHAWLLDREENAASRLTDGNGYTRTGEVSTGLSTQEVIEKHLDAEMPDWRDYEKAALEFYQEFEPVVDEASFNRTGRHIERNETYAGKILQTDDGGNPRETHRRASGRAGTTLKREDTQTEVEVMDIHRNLMSHINEVTHDITHLEFEQDAQAIFSDPARRKWIKAHIGERTLSMVDEHINDIILGYNRSQKTVDTIAAWLRENMFGHFLLGKPEQAAKQLTGAIICLETIGPDAAIQGWEYMIANPEETEKLMQESGIWQSRVERRDPDYHPDRVHKRFAQTIGGHALEIGDKYGAAAAAFPIYLEELRTTGNKEAALKKFETAIATQSSGRIEDLPALFRGNAWMKIAAVMSQEPTAAVERISIAWRKYRATGKMADLRQYWRVVAITHVASLLYQLTGYAYWYPFYTDEERAKKLAFIGATFSPYTGLPMAGQFLGYSMVGIFRYGLGLDISKVEPDVFPSFGAEFVRFSETLMKEGTGVEETDLLKLLQEAADLAGVTHGLPVGNYIKGGSRIGRALAGEN